MKAFMLQGSDSPVASRRGLWQLLSVALVFLSMAPQALAAASLTQQIIPDATHVIVGQPVTMTLTVKNAKVREAIKLPHVDGLVLNGSGTNPSSISESFYFFLTPTRAGDFTIPAFDVHTDDGQTLHANAIKLHATGQ